MNVEQGAVGVEDENGCHGILWLGPLWSQGLAIAVKALCVRSNEWCRARGGRGPGLFMMETGAKAMLRSWACAITPGGFVPPYSMARAPSKVYRPTSTCISRGRTTPPRPSIASAVV